MGYSVERRQGRGKWLRCNFTDVSETQYTVTALSPGDRFEFRVIARNAVGTISPPSNSSAYIMTKDESSMFQLEMNIRLKHPSHLLQYTMSLFVSHYLFTLVPSTVSPEIEWSPDQQLTLRAGENIKLNCSITGRPVPQVIWYKDGKEIDKRIMIDIEISMNIGTSSLFIRDADRNHRGLYTVEAKNSSGTKKADVNVRVQGW